jgi:hypothetical protein
MGFEKFPVFARNPWVLAYGFTENCQFGAKTDRNSIFPGRDRRIANRLPKTVPYCESVIYNGPVFYFLRVLKNFPFLLERRGC